MNLEEAAKRVSYLNGNQVIYQNPEPFKPTKEETKQAMKRLLQEIYGGKQNEK